MHFVGPYDAIKLVIDNVEIPWHRHWIIAMLNNDMVDYQALYRMVIEPELPDEHRASMDMVDLRELGPAFDKFCNEALQDYSDERDANASIDGV